MHSGGVLTRSGLIGVFLVLLALAVACSGGTPAPSAQAPQQPAPAAAPAAAAPAADPAAPSAPTSSTFANPAPAPAPAATSMIKSGGILRVGHRSDPPAAWDSMRSTNYNNTLILPSIYGESNLGMACREEELRICPALAESWESENDFTVWTFKLRDNVNWHDGAPFTAEDVVFWSDLVVNGATTGDRTRQPATNKARFGDLVSVEALDGNRVRFTMAARDHLLLDRLTYRIFLQHPKHLAESQIRAGNVDVSPVDLGYIGTGPFKFQDYQKGVAIEVRRQDNFWEVDDEGNRLPYLDGIDFFIIKEPAAYHAAFRSRRLDVGLRAGGFYVPFEMVPSYKKSLGDDFWFGQQAGGTSPSLAFNTTRPPFDDVRVRQAIWLWTDRQSAMDTFSGGYGRLAGMMEGSAWWNDDIETWPGYNPATKAADRAQAKVLLAEAGYGDDFGFTLLAPRTFSRQVEWWLGELAGIANVELELLDVAAHDQKVSEGNYQAVQGSAVADTPQDLLTRWGSKDLSPFAKPTHYDPKISDFINRIGQEIDLDAQRTLVKEMERYVMLEQAMYIRGFLGVSLVPYMSYVKGMYHPETLAPSTYVSYSTVWLDK